MKVEVRCIVCSDDNDSDIFMHYTGPLTISEDKTQCQEYECLSCSSTIQICINILQRDESKESLGSYMLGRD